MCDTLIAAPDGGPIWIAKNSDREAGESQAVEWHPGSAQAPGRIRCTHAEVSVPARRHAIVIGRPTWMWGAEMGANERGVVIANEAVFTKRPPARDGLTGMDILRLALEQADNAEHAVAVIQEHSGAQGGRMGHRAETFRYHSSFAVADAEQAWVVETAGAVWAARRVRGVTTLSNCLSIGTDYDLIDVRANEWAGRRASNEPLDFARSFARTSMEVAGGAHLRRSRSREAMPADPSEVGASELAEALSSHARLHPSAGWRMQMPCAHASWMPSRRAGQTTNSMVARAGLHPQLWMTGTSSPCLSVFKPLSLDTDVTHGEPPPAEGPDRESLWWRHERLHREVLGDYERRSAAVAPQLAELRAQAWRATSPSDMAAVWAEHRAGIEPMRNLASREDRRRRGLFQRYWERQSRIDGLAAL